MSQIRIGEMMMAVAAVAIALAWPVLLWAVVTFGVFAALDRVGLWRWSWASTLACLVLAVSPYPLLLFVKAADDEPFVVFQRRHALLYLGLGSVLLVILVELSGLVAFGMIKGKLSAWWTVVLLWVIFLGIVSYVTAEEWIGDLTRAVSRMYPGFR